MRILANDGIDPAGKALLEAAGFLLNTDKVPQSKLAEEIGAYDVLVVRSATKVTAEVLEASRLKLIARAGVGTDNIDMEKAAALGIPVVNTPNAGSRSVAELVFAHLFSLARFLPVCNRIMPERGISAFSDLKKMASGGFELKGKKLGIIGFGRIGKEVARMAIGLGMEVLPYDHKHNDYKVDFPFHPALKLDPVWVDLPEHSMAEVLEQSDFLTLHTPGADEVIGAREIGMMKQGAVLIQCARGGVVNEAALFEALNSGHIAYAGLDVFENEPPTDDHLLKHPNVSLSPHIGASTREGQERIGLELAERIIQHFG